MKTKNTYVIVGLFLLGLSGCAVTDFDRLADFTQYKTYDWGKSEIDVSNPVYESDLIRKRVRHMVEDEFAKRGIMKNERNPDFIVRYHTYTEEKQRTYGGYPYMNRFLPFGFYPLAFAWGYPYMLMTPPHNSEYTEGTLMLDIIDRQSDELIWRGSVSGTVDDISKLRKQIDKGIKAIMKKYPVSPEAPLNIGTEQKVIS